MAIFTGTIWLNIGTTQSEVQDRFSVHFFAAAFLCSMTIAVIPAFIEEKNVFDRERRNASYGVLSYVLSNTLMSLPFVLLLAVVFTIIAYPMIGLHRGADKWSKFLLTLFLALYCAESIVLFVSGVFPIFIVALALLAFLTGFFLLVQGFFVAYENLPAFWIWAHYWSYQSYAFENLVYNDFTGLTFSCDRNSDGSCFCAVPSSLNAQCEFTGTDVLSLYDYQNTNFWLKTGILVIQIVTYRLLFYVILRIKKK
jgi:ABC-type multidrug transport system permease subunit